MGDTKQVPLEPTEEMGRVSGMRFKCHCGRAITQWAVNKWADMLAAAPPEDELARLERKVRNELARAMTKFPTWPTDPIHAAMVIAEESGELTQAVLQACYEPGKPAADNVYDEAIQTAAMCLRFLLSLDGYVFQPGPQHEQVWVKEGER